MKKVIPSLINEYEDNKSLSIKMWLDDEEPQAMEQITNLSSLPFAFHHIAIMPDCHSGYGMPIGGVLATKGVVIPNAVGVDIGCGMCAVKTSLKAEQLDKENLKKIMGKIREVIPVGFEHQKEFQNEDLMPNIEEVSRYTKNVSIVESQYASALKQLGTLGGGNHFIEIQKDKNNYIWIMIHSGSRNLGHKVATHYNELAVDLNKKWYSSVPKNWELAFLPMDSDEGKAYIREMNYCIDFALANRNLMLHRILKCIASSFYPNPIPCENILYDEIINIAHNYAKMENHFGENVMIHRKGATLARTDTIGIIPGSQGSKSYIVRGKGNPDSFMSCSHGAGRKMSRTKAQKELNLEVEIKRLDELDIIHGIRSEKDLDEATGAYKDIDEVMKNQEDLVEIVEELTPIAVIKG